ncbi:16111_t:CDS:1, partial [Gigaspora rosea]
PSNFTNKSLKLLNLSDKMNPTFISSTTVGTTEKPDGDAVNQCSIMHSINVGTLGTTEKPD